MFQRLRSEADAIVSELIELSWYMRGAIQYHNMWFLSPFERDKVRDFVGKTIELAQKNPFIL